MHKRKAFLAFLLSYYMPFLTVIIPTYHRNDLLALCLKRLSGEIQGIDPDEYEVIVSDDGKACHAKSMIEKDFPWAKWVQGPQKGPAANRNNGARYAQGIWLVFTDDDCLPDSKWLSSFYRETKSCGESSLILEGRTTCAEGVDSPLMHSPVNEKGGYLWSCNMAITKASFLSLNGFDEVFPYPHLEDVDFRERALEKGLQLRFVRNAIVDHPPRRYHTFKKLAQTHESEIYYFAKKDKSISWAAMCTMVLRVKLRTLLRYPFHRDSFVYLSSTLYELVYISLHFRRWHKKYQYLDKQ